MAKQKTNGSGQPRKPGGGPPPGGLGGQQFTGRHLVLLPEGEPAAASIKGLSEKAGFRVARSSDFGASDIADTDADAIVFDQIGVAVVTGDPGQLAAFAAAEEDGNAPIIEPERVVYAFESPLVSDSEASLFEVPPGVSLYEELPSDFIPAPTAAAPEAPAAINVAYLEGYRDAIESLLDRARASARAEYPLPELGPEAIREAQNTYGLQITRVVQSRASGLNIKVAVLDTGLDLRHPDFAGRSIVSRSFVAGEEVQDGNGHGTHCIGTACGPRVPAQLPRYGVAYQSQIFAGKVLSNLGRGADGGILGGIDWAIANGCRVVSMSLGAATEIGQTYSRVYENVARRALARGTLIIAAAGNESRRPNSIKPVGHPANCPSIMAVGAIDANFQLGFFTTRGLNPLGGQVDIVGPGVDVYSSYPMPARYRRLSGTSMATPHVAGIAALWCQVRPSATASDIWRLLVTNARRLPQSAADVGNGLVQAP